MRVMNEQWRDSLRGDRYPFADTGTITATDGLILPEDCFLDLNILIDQDTTEVLLLDIVTVANTPAIAHFTLSDGTAVGTLDFADLLANGQVPIRLGTAVVGVAVLDPNAAQIVSGWPAGTHLFNNITIIPHLLVALDKRWRRGFELPDGTILEGDCYLIADRGLWMERTAAGFRLHVTGDPFNGRSKSVRGLKTINGLPPIGGNFNLIGLSEVAFTGTTYTGGTTPFRITVKPTTQSLTIDLIGLT